MEIKFTNENAAEPQIKESWVKPEADVLSVNKGTLGIFGHFFNDEILASV